MIMKINTTIKHLVRVKKDLLNKKPELIAIDKDQQRISKNDHSVRIFEAIESIFNADISSIYSTTNTNNEFYVYAHCNPLRPVNINKGPKQAFAAKIGLNFIPFYIGKGTNRRCFDTNRNEGH